MRIHATQRHFRRAVAFGAVWLHAPVHQGLDQRLLLAAVKLAERHIRDLA